MAESICENKSSKLFLGFDCSTQSLKCTVVDRNMKVVYSNGINYDKELSRFNISNGIVKGEDGSITTPTLLWVAAYDLLLKKMKEDAVDFSKIRAISVSGQQHGSVYWKKGAQSILEHLNPELSLEEQLKDAFSISNSPIWMDSTTFKECQHLEKEMGGYEEVAKITGSRAYERFTGNQIAKIYNTKPDLYEETERISLVSSFSVSLFLGQYARIDVSDGSGMNLLNIKSKEWCSQCLDLCAPGLKEKLEEPVNSWEVLGPISSYFVERFHFSKDCLIVPGSGDNNCSLTALGLIDNGQLGVSLGTSNTFFGITSTPCPGKEGHIFASPIDPHSYMCMLCYKNGDFVRAEANNTFCEGRWDLFSETLRQTAPGNDGYVVIKLNEPEITPHIMNTGLYLWDPEDQPVAVETPEQQQKYKNAIVRGIIEYQFISMRIHGESIGISSPTKLIATGGASNNKDILQILSDIFNCPVYVISQSDSASLGASYRALHATACDEKKSFVPYPSIITEDYLSTFTLSNVPNEAAHRAYSDLIERYKKHEQELEDN